MDKGICCMTHCVTPHLHDEISFLSFFFLLNFIGVGGLQRQMADMNGCGMNRVKMHDKNNRTNSILLPG